MSNKASFPKKTGERLIRAAGWVERQAKWMEGYDFGRRGPPKGDPAATTGGTGRPTGLFKVLVAPNGVDAHGPVYNVFDNADTGLTTPLGIALSPDPLSRWRGAGLPVGAAPSGSPGVAHYEGLTLVLDLVGETMCAGDGGFPAETG